MGRSDEVAAKAAGVCRQTVNEWRNHDADFIRALNIAKNELARATMDKFKEKMAALTKAAIDEIGRAIKRGDAQTARWLLEKVEIGNHARKIFESEIDPVILPEDMESVIDELAGQRVDEFLSSKNIGALERLRVKEALTAREAEALRQENANPKSEKED